MNIFFFLQSNPGLTTGNETTTGVKNVPIWDIIDQSNGGIGWLINLILLIMLGYTVFVFVERFLALRKATKEDTGLLTNIKTHLANDNIQGAKDACEASDSPISIMLAKGISRIGSAKNESIAATIENTGKFEILRL
ncbi:MAG: hypothetical protein RL273_541, partial [Bacteroidota bacterium]